MTKLGKVLFSIENINREYYISIPCYADSFDYVLTADLECMVEFIEDDAPMERSSDEDFCPIIDVSLSKEIVKVARNQKPDCSEEELVKCLVFYLRRDAFYIFDPD